MTSQSQIQLGKKGLTKEFLEDLKKRFEKPATKNLKISVLKSARESKEDVKKYSEEIKEFLGKKFTTRVLGFSIFIKKWRKEVE
jgi:RNA-binding protein YhbY